MKKKKNNNEEEMENFLDVLIRNYKTVPGVKIVLKLFFYFLFIIIFLMIIYFANSNNNVEEENKQTQTTTQTSKNYYDLISELQTTKKEIIKLGDITLNLDINDSITGYIEKQDEIKKIIIKDNKLYEVNNGIEYISDLINDASFLNPIEVCKYLLNNKSIKLEENGLFTYKYDNLVVYIENEKISKIVVNDGYEIIYN